jgi:hypothetical protein
MTGKIHGIRVTKEQELVFSLSTRVADALGKTKGEYFSEALQLLNAQHQDIVDVIEKSEKALAKVTGR